MEIYAVREDVTLYGVIRFVHCLELRFTKYFVGVAGKRDVINGQR
jgi:hypothetical protein